MTAFTPVVLLSLPIDGPPRPSSRPTRWRHREPNTRQPAVRRGGLDGSASSITALHYAAAEAHLRDASLRVVGVYIYDDSAQEAERATQRVNDAVHAARELGCPWPGEVDVTVHEGAVPDVLHRAASNAVLLVLGADGQGLLGRFIAGSVLPAMTHHVNVPTVIVPLDWRG